MKEYLDRLNKGLLAQINYTFMSITVIFGWLMIILGIVFMKDGLFYKGAVLLGLRSLDAISAWIYHLVSAVRKLKGDSHQ